MKAIRDAIPHSLSETPGVVSLVFKFFSRDVILAVIAWTLATSIGPYFNADTTQKYLTPIGEEVARWLLGVFSEYQISSIELDNILYISFKY